MTSIKATAAVIAVFAAVTLTACRGQSSEQQTFQSAAETTAGIQAAETTVPVTTAPVTEAEEPAVGWQNKTIETETQEIERITVSDTPTFSELPSGFGYNVAAMSSPRAGLRIEEDGSFTINWSRLTPQLTTDPETGEDLSARTVRGNLTNLRKVSDFVCQCEVAYCDSDDYTEGETVTILLAGASVDLLPDKHYPWVLGFRYSNGKLDTAHLYFENEDAIWVG